MDSANRIFLSLEALDAAERPLSLPELQKQVGCPTSSLAVTLRSLVQLGYVHHDRSRRTYAPTVQLAELGSWVTSRFALPPALKAAAREVSVRTGLNVSIAHRNDVRAQYLFFLPANKAEPTVRVGTTRLLCRSSIGWALMMPLSDRTVLGIVRRTNKLILAEDALEPEGIRHILQEGRRKGFVHSAHTVRAGYGVIAMPLTFANQALAVGVSGPAVRLDREEASIVAAMKDVIEALPG